MPKQLNVNMSFTADTSQAKRQLQDLQKQLTELGTKNLATTKFINPKDVQDASHAIAQLKTQLTEATNINTGTLDLFKFKEQLDQGGISLAQYREQFAKLGPAGQKAFNDLTDSILAAEVPLKRNHALLDQFWTALKNTARWQISSSALHSFMSTMQGAYGYAQDLNKSLNSIRIVTGQSTDQMAELATQANKTAQALSTSTLAYTDAALIYYQQGLEGQDVAERVETTLKMSNVTGESAEEVSSYMTAIWNNFRTGGESLESFADKITALGAATASSSREIAGGLQQFAAIADTVGLSYDYAASALATVVAQTRQSESTVGNAFRTIFSRLEGLKLGETLEDGTDLNKYSGALQTIGVNIKDQNGELKQMDTILEEIGAKWETLSRDQQIALTQTVGGVRQYANLIALFDNWDTFQKNLTVSMNANGTLDEQAKIYAESWEAAKKRVKAAAQEIYQNLIDEDFFISVSNLTEDLLHQINGIIEAFGGLKGILSTVIALILQLKGAEIGKGISTALYNLTPTSIKQEASMNIKKEVIGTEKIDPIDQTKFAKTQANNLNKYRKLQEDILAKSEQLTQADRNRLTILLDQNKALQKNTEELAKQLDEAKQQTDDAMTKLYRSVGNEQRNSLKAALLFGNEEEAPFEKQLTDAYTKKMNASNANDSAIAAMEIVGIEDQLKEKFTGSKEAVEAYSEAIGRQVLQQQKYLDAAKILESHTEGITAKMGAASEIMAPVGDAIVNVAMSFASLVSAINAFKGIWETIQNPDLSLWQKLASIIPALAMALTTLTRVQLKANLASLKDGIIRAGTIVAKIKDTGVTVANTAATETNTTAKGKNTVTTGEATAGSLAHTGAMTAETGGALSLTAALSALWSVLWPIALALGGLAALIWAIDEGIYTSNERIADTNKELEKAEENLNRVSDAISEAKQNYEDLSSIFDKFEIQQEKIANLDKHTREWNQTINETNSELLDTLDRLGLLDELSGKLQRDSNGLLYLSPEDQKAALEVANQQLAFLQAVKTVSSISMVEAKRNADLARNAQGIDIEETKTTRDLKRTAGNGSQEGTYEVVGESTTTTKWSDEQVYDVITSAAQKIANNEELVGKSSEDLQRILSDEGDILNSQLSNILKDIPDIKNRKDILDAIANAADIIVNAENSADTYESELGRQGLESLGLNEGIPEYAMNEVYQKAGQKFAEAINPKAIRAEASRLMTNPTSADSQAALDSYVAKINAGGEQKVHVDAFGSIIDDTTNSKVDFSWADVAKVKLTEDAITNADREELEGIIDTAKQSAKEETEKVVAEKFNEVFGTSSSVSSMTDEQLDAANNASKEELSEYKSESDYLKYGADKHSHELNIDARQLSQFKGKTEDLNEEVQKLSSYLKNNVDNIAELDKSLKYCQEGIDEIAYSMIRFDDALQDVEKNYDNWKALLDSGDLMSNAKAVDELKTAYANLLDMDAGDFNQEFLTSAENLDLFNKVLTGTEEEAIAAYDKLARLAEVSFIQVTLDVDKAQAENIVAWFEDITNQLSGYKIHMEIEDADAIAKLESFINTVAADADQAAAILSEIGYDAEVTQEPVTEEEKRKIIDLVPKDIAGKWVDIPVAAQDPEQPIKSQKVYYPGIGYNGMPSDVVAKSQKTATALKIKSLRKNGKGTSGGGNIKVKNSPTRSNYTPKSSGGGGGGGGGGSQPKQKTPKQHKEHKFLQDRYHNIKSAIDEVAKALERVDKLKERAYGKAKLKYMDQEIDKLQDQVRLQDEYIKQAKQYLNIDRKALEGLGLGAKFTDDGRLLNYEQVLQGIEDEYNSAVAAYNEAVDVYNSTEFQDDAEDEAFKANEKMMEAAEKKLSRSQEILKQYEDTYNTLQEQIDKRTELLYQIYDAKLAKAVWKVEIKIEVNEADIKYLEWMNKFLEKFETNTLDVMANLSKMADDTFSNIEAIQSGMSELFENHGIKLDFNNLDGKQLANQLKAFMETEGLGSEITEEEAKQIREWNEKLMQYADNWVDYWTKTHELIDKTSEEWNKKIDREIDKLEMFTEILDHYSNIINLTGSQLNVSDEDVLKIHDAKIRNGKNELESLRAQRDGILAELQAARTNLANAQTDEAKKFWEDHVKGFEDTLNELDSKIRSQWEDVLQWAGDRFDKALEAADKKFEKRFNNLSLIMERFDNQLEANHLYLDDYEKYYELNKSAKELQKMVDNTNNSMMKTKYKDYLDEINGYMSTGVRMTQAQTDLVAKRVELLKAEDDLLNARNAKNTVRMTRDNEGNFSYTYSADQDAIDDAELAYQEAFYNFNKSTRDYMEGNQQDFLQYASNYKNKMLDLERKKKNNEITDDEYNEASNQYTTNFQDYRQKYLEEMRWYYEEEARLRDEDIANVEEIMDLKLAEYDDFWTEYDDTILSHLIEDITSEEELVQAAFEAEQQLLVDNIAATQQWEEDIKSICEAAGVDVDTFRETMINDLIEIDQKSNETKENITIMANQMKEDMDSIMKKALEMDKDWANHMQSMREQIKETVNEMNIMLATLADVSTYEHIAGEQAEFAAANIKVAGDEALDAAGDFRELADAVNEAADAMERLNAAGGGSPGGSGGTTDGGDSSSYHTSGTVYGGPNAGHYMEGDYNNGSWTITDVTKSNWKGGNMGNGIPSYVKLATGGYTGAWGSEGKFAMLHEKELVLNKEDTSNILGVVNTVRDIAKSINFNEGLNGFVNSIMNAGKLAFAGGQDLNQNVHIEASFPNVQSHSEIELALNNLINSATQYVNRS